MLHQAEYMIGKIILVAGATTPTGEAIVHYFLEKGATVIAPVKSLNEITKLKAGVANISNVNLITELAELPDYDTGLDIAEAIVEKFGCIHIGISFFPELRCKSQLTELNINDWQTTVDNELTPFFVSARLILHTMKNNNGGLYISLCDGSLPDGHIFQPLSKIATNVKMEMSKLFAAETKKYNVKYYHLAVNQNNTPQDSKLISKEVLGDFIMKLYLGKSEKPDEVFQFVTG
jgi:NADP-dependent 3-hydroxy acid dehydrogenase YdfG